MAKYKRVETKFKVGDKITHKLFPHRWIGRVLKYKNKSEGIIDVKWDRDGSIDTNLLEDDCEFANG